MRALSILLIYVFFLSACSTNIYYSKSVQNWASVPSPDSSHLAYSVYLIGDAGGALTHKEPTLTLLEKFISKDSNSTTIFLGDNIYFNGLPAESALDRNSAEKKIRAQMDILHNYKGYVYFIAGNHDWDYMRQNGLQYVIRQEQYVESYLSRGNTYVPDNGCPGPFFTSLPGNVVFIALDSQWWLHKYEKPYGRCADCNAEDENDLLVQLEDYIKNNRNKHIIIAAHHPLYSNGNHGGHYTLMDHIFPLRLIRPKWYIPIPVIGSLYPYFRKFGGSDQDIPHYRYQEYKNELLKILSKYDNIIYTAGHDHNLQLHQTDSLTHIISGSGSKLNPVKGGEGALFTDREKGFCILKYYKNGEAWVEFWAPKGDGDEGKMLFRYKLYSRKSDFPQSYCSLSATDYSDSTVVTRASERYERSKWGRFFLGDHYREEWYTPVRVPLLDLKTEQGGLIPYGIGGRKQSVSLKLQNLDEKEYILRQVNKSSEKAIPEYIRNTMFEDIAQDQISAQHPYGALTIGRMSDAIHILHTNPKLVLVPNDSCLGPYREQFQNTLAFFEENPDENHKESPNLGYSKNIIGTDRMRDRLESDNDNRLDERDLLRVRLFDMLIGDWDRHDRQYRWATIETKKGEIYRPVPEDRDQVFYKFDGLLPYIASRKWAIRNLQNFSDDFKDIKGLNASARFLDKRYLSSLSKSDWISIADSIKNELTDQVIEEAIHQLPDSIFRIHGPEIIAKLKSRREKLTGAAEKYYNTLSEYVDIFGSDKNEKFEVERVDNATTRVTIYKVNKEGETRHVLYKRDFYKKETHEIRLYGLGGADLFEVKGKVSKGIKVRLIGGEDNDTLRDASHVAGLGRRTIFYDTKENNVIKRSAETRTFLSQGEIVNYPNQDHFFYNYLGPNANLSINPDDGIFLGLGLVYRHYKFRSNPYGSRHSFLVSRATTTGATRIQYNADIKNFIRKYTLGINFDMYSPAFVLNFFGYGNESVRDKSKEIEYYHVRLQHAVFNPSLNKEITRFLQIGIGPQYQYFQLQELPNTRLSELAKDPSIYSSRQYAGLKGFFRLGTKDNLTNPTRGIMLWGEANYNFRLDAPGSYSKYLSEFSFYITPNLPFQLTFASRLGGGMNFGSYEFYQANALGTTSGLGQAGNLRGFRRSRFIGDKMLYHNAEVRMQLFRFNAYVFTSKIGVLALLDNGRVWAKNEISKTWHTGYGGGLWMNVYNRTTLTATYAISKDDKVFNFRLGFQF